MNKKNLALYSKTTKPGTGPWIRYNNNAIPHLLRALKLCPEDACKKTTLVDAANNYARTNGENVETDLSPTVVISRGLKGIDHLRLVGYITTKKGEIILTEQGERKIRSKS